MGDRSPTKQLPQSSGELWVGFEAGDERGFGCRSSLLIRDCAHPKYGDVERQHGSALRFDKLASILVTAGSSPQGGATREPRGSLLVFQTAVRSGSIAPLVPVVQTTDARQGDDFRGR